MRRSALDLAGGNQRNIFHSASRSIPSAFLTSAKQLLIELQRYTRVTSFGVSDSKKKKGFAELR